MITLPLPPTTNHMYGHHGSIQYKTKELREWEQEAGLLLKSQWRRKMIEVPIYCGIEIFYKFNRDVDNLKAIPDLLADCGVIKNDLLIEHMNIKKFKDKENPRVEVEIVEISPITAYGHKQRTT